MKFEITKDKYLSIDGKDNELIETLETGNAKNITVICFENDFMTEHEYDKLAGMQNINKIIVIGIKKKKDDNKKIIFTKHIKDKFFTGTENVIFSIKTDIDDEILKPIIKLKDLCDKKHFNFGINTGESNFIGYSDRDDVNLTKALEAVFAESLARRNEIIYDYLCEWLDEKFKDNTICKFANDRCVVNRKSYTRGPRIMGCCESFDFKFGLLTNIKLCEKLGDKGCTAKCLGCKLFTCEYLRKQGIRFKLENIILAKSFFTKKQREIIRLGFFIEKEEVLKRVLHAAKN